MTSRWAYEALTVEQFRNNRYMKEYFDMDKEISNVTYLESFLVPTLQSSLDECMALQATGRDKAQLQDKLSMIRREVGRLASDVPEIKREQKVLISTSSLEENVVQALHHYLDTVRVHLRSQRGALSQEKTRKQTALQESLGGLAAYTLFRNSYENEQLSDMLLNNQSLNKIQQKGDRLIRKYEPVFMEPRSRLGRAPLYAASKQLGNIQIDTLWYNVLVIWFSIVILYLTLYHDTLRKFLEYLESIQIRRKKAS
jgi:hypothetical protein